MNTEGLSNNTNITGRTAMFRNYNVPLQPVLPTGKESSYQILGTLHRLLVQSLLLLSLGIALTPAYGQDTEPNNSCSGAQDLGAITLPFSLDGELYPSPDGNPYISLGDVDYYRFTATPGSTLQIDQEGQSTGQGTLIDPLLGLYHSPCFLYYDRYEHGGGGVGNNARLKVEVPPNGIVVIAASSGVDIWSYPPFSGWHSDQGTYRLTVTQVPVIGSISGHVGDAVFGSPLPGNVAPFAVVELRRCDALFGFCYAIAYQNAQADGAFRFERDPSSGMRLERGTYQIGVSANEYQPAQSAEFTVAEDQHFDVPDVLVSPFPVKISEIRPCGDLPPEGGTCRFSFRVRNQMATSLTGNTWSLVDNRATGSFIPNTLFQVGAQSLKNLATGASVVKNFSFRVPATLTDGNLVCATAMVGQGADPFFRPVGSKEPLFCILKGFTGGLGFAATNRAAATSGGFQVLSEEESQRLYHLRGQGAAGNDAVLTIPAAPAPSN